ncbi:MAG: hypothetical protein Q9220_006691 [cf. Caloplaca sp. 1 TL-2023]
MNQLTEPGIQLYIYPIKSLRAVPLASAVLTPNGFPHDRRFMLFKIDQPDHAKEREMTRMTVTYFPQLGLFTQEVHPSEGEFTVTFNPPPPTTNAKEMAGLQKTLRLPLQPRTDNLKKLDVSLHGSPVQAFEMGEAVNDWFSDAFGWEVVLVYMPPGNTRAVLGNLAPTKATAANKNGEATNTASDAAAASTTKSWFSTFTNFIPQAVQSSKKEHEGLTFADCAPYLVVTQESVQNVSKRLPDGVVADITKFRPNIVIEGATEPYEEDYWGSISILASSINGYSADMENHRGDGSGPGIDIILTQNCIRCQSLDIDYTNGTFAKSDEGTMLKKLMRDRRVDAGKKYSPVFGRYGFLDRKESTGGGGGVVRIGDEIQVTRRNEQRTKFCMFRFLSRI